MKYKMTRDDFQFLWHYRGSGVQDIRHVTIRNILINCGQVNPSYDKSLPNNTPHGLQGALNSMEPESYEYVQNVHGYTVREPSVGAEKWDTMGREK